MLCAVDNFPLDPCGTPGQDGKDGESLAGKDGL